MVDRKLMRVIVVILLLGGALGLIVAARGWDSPQRSGPPRIAGPRSPAGLPIEKVSIAGGVYKLEMALTTEVRYKGLSGRETIDADGGMIFVFEKPLKLAFVMRDCLVDIDIIFLDPFGTITAMHHMPTEPPRDESEPKPTDPRQPDPYEQRLKKYPSKTAAQFAIELKGGTLKLLDPPLKRGQKIKLDLKKLKKYAKQSAAAPSGS